MKRFITVLIITVFFISYAYPQINSGGKTDTLTTKVSENNPIKKNTQFLTIGLIITGLLSIILLAGIILLFKKNRTLLRIISIKSKEIEINNQNNRALLETAHCNLVDKDILVKKIIRDKEAALKEKEELQLQVNVLNEEINKLQSNQIEKIGKQEATDDNEWKNKFEENQKIIDTYKENMEFGAEFHQKLEELELNIIKIKKLENLFSEQVISQEEYEQKRKKLLLNL
jgi:hypothetical protein